MHPPERPPRPGDLRLLTKGEITVRGRLPWSSNGTFLVDVGCGDGEAGQAVYKPLRGERPLWDYPSGLYKREVAACVVSDWLGWGIVPPTVLRDGPFGPGSLQRFMDADFAEHYFTLLERPEHHDDLKAICAFDVVVNSGDRKSGHCLVAEGRLWAIDNGLCLHAAPKLRTVIWDFAGQPVPDALMEDVARMALATSPPHGLADLLEGGEFEALVARAAALVRRPVFPDITSSRAFPWPLV